MRTLVRWHSALGIYCAVILLVLINNFRYDNIFRTWDVRLPMTPMQLRDAWGQQRDLLGQYNKKREKLQNQLMNAISRPMKKREAVNTNETVEEEKGQNLTADDHGNEEDEKRQKLIILGEQRPPPPASAAATNEKNINWENMTLRLPDKIIGDTEGDGVGVIGGENLRSIGNAVKNITAQLEVNGGDHTQVNVSLSNTVVKTVVRHVIESPPNPVIETPLTQTNNTASKPILENIQKTVIETQQNVISRNISESIIENRPKPVIETPKKLTNETNFTLIVISNRKADEVFNITSELSNQKVATENRNQTKLPPIPLPIATPIKGPVASNKGALPNAINMNAYHKPVGATTTNNRTASANMVILLNTLGRGGSTFTSEIVSTFTKNTFFLFEPIKILQDNKKRIIPSISMPLLRDSLSCQIENVIESSGMFSYMNLRYIEEICQHYSICIAKKCLSAELRLIKEIRLPVSHMGHLLHLPGFDNLRVIYLVRDPRAQMVSRSLHFIPDNPDFGFECERLSADARSYRQLSRQHPTRFHFVRYEDISRDVYGKSRELLRFVTGNPTAELNNRTLEYLQQHTMANGDPNTLNTYRNTTEEWDMWRTDGFNSSFALEKFEKDCRIVMDRMGYVTLGSMENVRNMTLNSTKPYYCSYWNC